MGMVVLVVSGCEWDGGSWFLARWMLVRYADVRRYVSGAGSRRAPKV